MTTVDPDTLERDPEVLRDIARRFRGRLALNAGVSRPGRINGATRFNWYGHRSGPNRDESARGRQDPRLSHEQRTLATLPGKTFHDKDDAIRGRYGHGRHKPVNEDRPYSARTTPGSSQCITRSPAAQNG